MRAPFRFRLPVFHSRLRRLSLLAACLLVLGLGELLIVEEGFGLAHGGEGEA